jgi:hypothetical protein
MTHAGCVPNVSWISVIDAVRFSFLHLCNGDFLTFMEKKNIMDGHLHFILSLNVEVSGIC